MCACVYMYVSAHMYVSVCMCARYVCMCVSCSDVPPGGLHGIAGGLSWFCRFLSRPCACKQADTLHNVTPGVARHCRARFAFRTAWGLGRPRHACCLPPRRGLSLEAAGPPLGRWWNERGMGGSRAVGACAASPSRFNPQEHGAPRWCLTR